MEDVIKIIYSKDEDMYGYQIKGLLKDKTVDNLYRILGETLCILDEVYTAIGSKRYEACRVIR